MARAHDLDGMTPGELHSLGIETLSMSLGTGHGDLPRAHAQAAQAMALFFASLSAENLEEPPGSHRAAPGEDGRALGERVRGG
jgi:hypothetical protein